MKNNSKYRINFIFLLKIFFIGILLSQLFIIIKLLYKEIANLYALSVQKNWFVLVGIIYFLSIIMYLSKSNIIKRILIIIKSFRIDLLMIAMFGGIFAYTFEGKEVSYIENLVSILTYNQKILMVLFPFIIFISLLTKEILDRFSKKENAKSRFLSDEEGNGKNDDKFNLMDQVTRFAEAVFNRGAKESLVFGIDAPWGTGKTTFVNMCKEYWRQKYNGKIIIYTFDPLKYEKKEQLLEKFVDGLIKEIRNNVFNPEIETLISEYTKLLSPSKISLSFLGANFEFKFSNLSIESILKELELKLESINKKIIIIIDDLDRLNYSAIKDILFVIKKAFTLPNISYVICYDTENITMLEEENKGLDKVSEFLEKFINIKTSLYIDNELLLNYFTEYKEESLEKNLFANPKLVAKSVEGLKDIFKAKDFYKYISFVGDARKLKRLINTILLLEVEKVDYDNYDFNKQDLIHLLLIYINYPNIFRKIYVSETHGKKGFFSVVNQYEDGYPKNKKNNSNNETNYKNSEQYIAYLEELTYNQRFLLNKVFNVDEKFKNLNLYNTDIENERKNCYACFNGTEFTQDGRNLEKYLNLITRTSILEKEDQYNFYVNLRNRILDGENIEYVFSTTEELSLDKKEANHSKLWRVLANSKLENIKLKEIIKYAINNMRNYSFVSIKDITVCFRSSLVYIIISLLNKLELSENKGIYSDNNAVNISGSAYWILGEGEYYRNGILDTLWNKNKSVLGLYDLLLFRIECCSDRGGDIYYLAKALYVHGNNKDYEVGEDKKSIVIEMRKISQYIFKIFKNNYIDTKKNIFDEINQLKLQDVCGMYYNSAIIDMDTNADTELLYLKYVLTVFIIYQLGNIIIDLGVGCGYYDLDGTKDGKGINKDINRYLFDVCFDPSIDKNNYLNFLDYSLMNYSRIIGAINSNDYKFDMDTMTKVINKNMLSEYWRKNREYIMDGNFKLMERKILTSNLTFSYQNDLDKIFEEYDKLLN